MEVVQARQITKVSDVTVEETLWLLLSASVQSDGPK